MTADVCPDMGMISCTTFPPSLQTSGDFPCRRHRVRHHITHSQCSKAYRCRVSDHRRRRLSGSSAERPSRQSGTMGTAPAGFVICTFTSGMEAFTHIRICSRSVPDPDDPTVFRNAVKVGWSDSTDLTAAVSRQRSFKRYMTHRR